MLDWPNGGGEAEGFLTFTTLMYLSSSTTFGPGI